MPYNNHINARRPLTLTLRPHQQRALDALLTASIGRVTIPTGGGKTLVMIEDVKRRLIAAETAQTVVIVAPRILLAVQLYEEFWSALNGTVDAATLHVHSGEVDCTSTTKIQQIQCHAGVCAAAGVHQLIFTTYNSLRRINEAGIDVDYIYYDEAHNSVRRDFFKEVAIASLTAALISPLRGEPNSATVRFGYSADPYIQTAWVNAGGSARAAAGPGRRQEHPCRRRCGCRAGQERD